MPLACWDVDVGAIQVKQVPEELHDAIRRRAADEGLSVGEYVLSVLRRDLALPSRRQWLDRLERREPVEGVDVAETLDAGRREREQELRAARRR